MDCDINTVLSYNNSICVSNLLIGDFSKYALNLLFHFEILYSVMVFVLLILVYTCFVYLHCYLDKMCVFSTCQVP